MIYAQADIEVDHTSPQHGNAIPMATPASVPPRCFRPVLTILRFHVPQDGGITQQLNDITGSVEQLHRAFVEHQRNTDARLVALDECIRGLGPGSSRSTNNPQREVPNPRGSRKDSSANYLRVCLPCSRQAPCRSCSIGVHTQARTDHIWLQQDRCTSSTPIP